MDVRRWPVSKTAHFHRDALKGWLADAGTEYVWLGEQLGGYRSGGYSQYMETAQFQGGFRQLLKLARQKHACLMCLEISPRGCHRRFIAERLNTEGVRTVHIISALKAQDGLRSQSA